MTKKRKLSKEQEFQVYKLVLDKFLWLGVIIMGFGLFKMAEYSNFQEGLYYIIAGAVVLLLLLFVLVREYEFVTK